MVNLPDFLILGMAQFTETIKGKTVDIFLTTDETGSCAFISISGESDLFKMKIDPDHTEWRFIDEATPLTLTEIEDHISHCIYSKEV